MLPQTVGAYVFVSGLCFGAGGIMFAIDTIRRENRTLSILILMIGVVLLILTPS